MSITKDDFLKMTGFPRWPDAGERIRWESTNQPKTAAGRFLRQAGLIGPERAGHVWLAVHDGRTAFEAGVGEADKAFLGITVLTGLVIRGSIARDGTLQFNDVQTMSQYSPLKQDYVALSDPCAEFLPVTEPGLLGPEEMLSLIQQGRTSIRANKIFPFIDIHREVNRFGEHTPLSVLGLDDLAFNSRTDGTTLGKVKRAQACAPH